MHQRDFGGLNLGRTLLQTLLCETTAKVRSELVPILLSRMSDQDIGLQNSSGETALLLAIERDQEDIALMIASRMDADALAVADKFGSTTFEKALEKKMMVLAEKMAERMLQITKLHDRSINLVATSEAQDILIKYSQRCQ